MAKSKHRKAHKQALSHWRAVHVQAEAVRLANQPKEVGKRKFQVQPDPRDDQRDAVIVEINGREAQAQVEPGGGTVTLTGGSFKKGDRVRIDYPGGRRAGMSEVHVAATPRLRGPARLLTYLDDFADFTPEQKAEMVQAGQERGKPEAVRNLLVQAMNCPPLSGDVYCTVSKERLEEFTRQKPHYPSMGCQMIHEHVDPGGLVQTDYTKLEERMMAQLPGVRPEDLIYGEPQALSMGCIVEDRRAKRGPDTCSICGAIWPCSNPEHSRPRAHFEMGWHKCPLTGQPVFDEISLCPGPDPNGITDLK